MYAFTKEIIFNKKNSVGKRHESKPDKFMCK